MNELVSQILTVVGPVVAAFVVGHFHVLIKPSPANPATPANPAVPVVPPVVPQIRPFGQGGAIDILGLLFSYVMTSPTIPNATKAAVSNSLVQVQDALTNVTPPGAK